MRNLELRTRSCRPVTEDAVSGWTHCDHTGSLLYYTATHQLWRSEDGGDGAEAEMLAE